MSSSDDEGSVCGAGFDPEGREPAGGRRARPTAPRGPRPGLGLGTPGSSEDFESELEEVEAGRRVLWGREGRPGSPANVPGHTLNFLAEEAATGVLQQLTNRDALSVRRNPSPESCATQVSTAWVDLGPSGRGARAHSWVGLQPLTSAGPLHLRGPEGGWLSANAKRGAKGRSTGTVDRQRPSVEGLLGPPSDPESSDEIDTIQPMRVTICRRGRGPARPSSPNGPGDTLRFPSSRVRESFLHVPGPFLSSATRGLPSAVERQAGGEQDVSFPKKMPSVVWGKAESRPSYPGVAAVGCLPPATPWRRAAQEKTSLEGASNLALGRSFPSWGQRVPAGALEPITFPTISAVPPAGKSKKSWAPLGIKQYKHTASGKKSMARRTRESELLAGEDKDPKRDPAPKGQPPAHKPGPSSLYVVHRGAFSSGDSNIRDPVVPRRSQLLALSQGDILPRGPAPSGDQELLDQPPRLERQQELPPGAEGCPRCPVLQKEIDELKEQLEAAQSLTDKFHSI